MRRKKKKRKTTQRVKVIVCYLILMIIAAALVWYRHSFVKKKAPLTTTSYGTTYSKQVLNPLRNYQIENYIIADANAYDTFFMIVPNSYRTPPQYAVLLYYLDGLGTRDRVINTYEIQRFMAKFEYHLGKVKKLARDH